MCSSSRLGKNQSLRSVKSITCGYNWSIRFRGIARKNNKISDPVIITAVNGIHYNTCDPSYIDQFVSV